MTPTDLDTAVSLLSHVALSVLLIGACGALALWLCRTTAATLRHTIALSVLAGVVVVPVLVIAVHLRTVETAALASPLTASPNTAEENDQQVRDFGTTEKPISSPVSHAATAGWRFGLLRTLCFLWGLGVVVAIVAAGRGLRHQRAYLSRLDKVANSEILEAIERIRLDMGIRRPVEVLSSRLTPWPFTVGIRKPKVILPVELLHTDDSQSGQLNAAIVHELGHVKRYDYAVLMLEQAVKVLLWWNPFVTSISTALNVAREEICDNFVLHHQGEGNSLAQYLVISMERAANAKFVWGVGMSANEPRIVKRRIKRLMSGDTNLMKIPNHTQALLFFSSIFLAIACVQASYAQSELRFGDPVNLGETVNAIGNGQVGITIGNHDLTILYTDVAEGDVIVPGQLIPARIWETNRESAQSEWQPPALVEELTPMDGGFALIAPRLSDDGLTLLYSQTYPEPGEDIWMATRTDVDQPWQGMQRLPEPVNSSEGFLGSNAATLSRDGNTMLFSSDRPGSEGKDLWQVTLNDEGEWHNPTRLPEPINTPHREGAPEISSDGLMLFFSSDRPGGFGNIDLYVSQRSSITESWGTPMNLGGAINTERNENNPGLSADDSLLYFRTRGLGGFGTNDIWSVTIVPEPSTTSLSVCGVLLFAGLYRRRK